MSHFAVIVVGPEDKLEQQLAPFQENNMGDCPKEYLAFNDVESDCRESYEKEEESVKVKYPTLDQYISKYCGYKKDPETGKYGYWENPNKKWDWYEVGGRWAGFFKIKPEFQHLYKDKSPNFSFGWDESEKEKVMESSLVDSALKKHIDFESVMNEAAINAEKLWDFIVEKIGPDLKNHKVWKKVLDETPNVNEAREIYRRQPSCKKLDELMTEIRNRKEDEPVSEMEKSLVDSWSFSLDNFITTKEKYIREKKLSSISGFAILWDGKWAERGRMGWFASVSNENENWTETFHQILDKVPDDETLTIVDCHI